MNPNFENVFIVPLNLIDSTRCASDLDSNNNDAPENMSDNPVIQNMDQTTSQQSEADSAMPSQKSTEREVKRDKITLCIVKNDLIQSKHRKNVFYR